MHYWCKVIFSLFPIWMHYWCRVIFSLFPIWMHNWCRVIFSLFPIWMHYWCRVIFSLFPIRMYYWCNVIFSLFPIRMYYWCNVIFSLFRIWMHYWCRVIFSLFPIRMYYWCNVIFSLFPIRMYYWCNVMFSLFPIWMYYKRQRLISNACIFFSCLAIDNGNIQNHLKELEVTKTSFAMHFGILNWSKITKSWVILWQLKKTVFSGMEFHCQYGGLPDLKNLLLLHLTIYLSLWCNRRHTWQDKYKEVIIVIILQVRITFERIQLIFSKDMMLSFIFSVS